MADDISVWILSGRTGFDERFIWGELKIGFGMVCMLIWIEQVDIALWDLKARKLGVPIYQLLGGKVRDKLKVYAWIGGDRPGDVEKQA